MPTLQQAHWDQRMITNLRGLWGRRVGRTTVGAFWTVRACVNIPQPTRPTSCLHPSNMQRARQAQIACYSCRQRKVKCDKALPFCSQCEGIQGACKYPAEVKRPGPKLGSVHKQQRPKPVEQHKKRRKRDPTTSSRDSTRLQQPEDVDSTLASPEPALEATRHRRAEGIQSISYIIHPSHESCSPQSSRLDVAPADATNGNESLLILASYTLGLTWEATKDM